MKTEDVLTSTAVASLLGVSRRHVLRLVKTGALRARKLPGGTGAYIFDPADVRAFIAERATRHDRPDQSTPTDRPADHRRRTWADVPLFSGPST